jgi:hypothetical protein
MQLGNTRTCQRPTAALPSSHHAMRGSSCPCHVAALRQNRAPCCKSPHGKSVRLIEVSWALQPWRHLPTNHLYLFLGCLFIQLWCKSQNKPASLLRLSAAYLRCILHEAEACQKIFACAFGEIFSCSVCLSVRHSAAVAG